MGAVSVTSLSLIMCVYQSQIQPFIYIHVNKYWFGWIFPCLFCIIHFSWVEEHGLAFWCQFFAAAKVIVSLLSLRCDNLFAATEGGIPGHVWRRSCLSSVAEHPQKWGCNPSPTQLVKQDFVALSFGVFKQVSPSHCPYSGKELNTYRALHFCSSTSAPSITPCCVSWGAQGAGALPVTLTCAGAVPSEVPQMSSSCAFGLPCLSLVIYYPLPREDHLLLFLSLAAWVPGV